MPIKKSISLSDRALNLALAHTPGVRDGTPSWSAFINNSVCSYHWLLAESLPELTKDEWDFILTSYNGIDDSLKPPARVASHLIDFFGEVDINKLPKAKSELINKIHNMNQVQQLAITGFNDIYWANDFSHCDGWDALYQDVISLMKCGVPVSG